MTIRTPCLKIALLACTFLTLACTAHFKAANSSSVSLAPSTNTSSGAPTPSTPSVTTPPATDSNQSSSSSSSEPVSSPAPVSTPTPSAGMPLVQAQYAAYGDSITGGFGASGNDKFFVSLLARDAHATLSNYARAGQTACSIASMEVFANHVIQTTEGSNWATVLEGTNDVYGGATIGVGEQNFNACQQASLSWLAIPYENKALAQSSSCVKSGNWQINGYRADAEMFSANQGDTMTCTLATTGEALYFWYEKLDNNGGTFTYSVDDGAPIALRTQADISLANAIGSYEQGVYSLRIPDLPAGSHRVKFTVTSASASNNTVMIWGLGTPPAAGSATKAPHIFVGGVPFQKNDAHGDITAAFNADVKANVAAMQRDHLPVSFVDIRQYWMGQASDMADDLHPNDVGHDEIKSAFEAAILGN